MAYKMNGCDTGGLPLHLVKPLIDNHYVPYFVETGTASGESALLASEIFKEVWTIELIEGRQDVKGDSNINWLVGDSAKLLPEVITQLTQLKGNKKNQWVLFYLDAHYSDIVPNESDYPECPLLKEIECVAEYGYDSIIIIDDARLFLGHPPYPHNPEQWPSILEVFLLLKEKFPYHHITITDDYILAIPLHVRDVIDKEWRERFSIRYPNEEDKLRSQYKDVWKDVKEKYSNFLKYVE